MEALTSELTPALPPSPSNSLLAVRAGRHQREHAAGGVAGDDDPVRLDAEAGGVGARPADRGLDVVNLRRPRALRLQPVVGRDARVAAGAERLGVVDDVAGVLVADEEATAKEVNDRHALRRDAGRRLVDVERQIDASALAEDDVLLDPQVADVRRRWPLRLCGDRRQGRCRGQCTRRQDESPPGKSRHISYPPRDLLVTEQHSALRRVRDQAWACPASEDAAC